MDSADGLPLPRRNWAVLCVALGILMAVLDGAIANVALPTIVRQLHTDPVTSIWVVNAYQLVITICLLPLASLGEIVGYRRVYRSGLAVFTLASLGCALSDSLPQLVAARILQGFGAAGMMSVSLALVRYIYPRALLGRGIGINTLVVALSAAAGPSVASAVLSQATWPWLFAVNLPFGLAALLASISLPKTIRTRLPFDVKGALWNAGAFGLFILSVDGLGHGAPLSVVAAEFVTAIVLGVLLVRREGTLATPMLPIDLLRLRRFRLAISTSICAFVAQMLTFVSLPFYLQNVCGLSQVETGLLMTPWPLAVALVSPFAGRLSDRFPAPLLGVIGLSIFAAGLAALTFLPAEVAAIDVAWRMATCGMGFSLFMTPNSRSMILAAPKQRSGAASGMLGMGRLLGQTSGAALVAVAFGWFPRQGLGTHVALSVACAFAIGAAVVSVTRLRPEESAPPISRRTD